MGVKWTTWSQLLLPVQGIFGLVLIPDLGRTFRGAIGVEMATDWYEEKRLLNTLAYNLWTAVEEGLEMGGVVLFIHALLGYMGSAQDAHVNVIVEK